MNIQNRDNFFTAGAHAIKKIKIFCSRSRFKTILQLFSTIEIVSVVFTIKQQTISLKKAVFALGFKKPSVITLRVALRKAVCLSDSFG